MNTNIHQPVMLNEILDVINFNECNFFLDGTYGGGGHSDEFLSRGCEVLALDNYVESEKLAIKKMNFEKNFLFYKSNFKDIDQVVSKNNIKKKFDGVLLDL